MGQFASVALVVALGLLLGLPAALASPPGSLGGAHWDVHSVSATASPQGRVVLVLDATGDAGVQQALLEFRTRWNAMRNDPPTAGLLPWVEVSAVDPSHGCARGTHAGDVVVCLDDTLATSGVGGPYVVDAEGHTQFGLVKLRRTILKWTPCNLRTAVAHEMGHVMGLGHNDVGTGAPSLMMSGKGPYNRGCPTWLNAQDKAVLQALYGHR